jgi:hypothetical protein
VITTPFYKSFTVDFAGRYRYTGCAGYHGPMSEERARKKMRYTKRVPAYDSDEGLRMWHLIAGRQGLSISALIRRLGRAEAERLGLLGPEEEQEGIG